MMVGEAWWKEHEAAGHGAFTSQKQSKMSSVMDTSSWDGAAHSQAGSSLEIPSQTHTEVDLLSGSECYQVDNQA